MKRGSFDLLQAVILIVIIIAIIISLFFLLKNPKITENKAECENDSDCVPATCCHSSSCVSKDKSPNCLGIFCTMSCDSILDCGQGICKCVKNKCEAIKK